MTLSELRQYLARVDLAMLAAAVVEVPRWAVAFMAIREPAYAAIPMGLLLAWAASAGWKAYFEDRRRYLLLCINVASLVGALVVIAPVLFAMTFQPLDAIDLSQVLPRNLLWAWAATLAITTFVPLVQVAAVKAYHARSAAPFLAQPAQPRADAPQPTQEPAPQDADAPATLTPAQRRAQIREQEITDPAQIAAQFGVSLRTAQTDIAQVRKALRQTNGATHA